MSGFRWWIHMGGSVWAVLFERFLVSEDFVCAVLYGRFLVGGSW